MLNQVKTRDLTEFGYNEPTSPGLPSHNTKEKSRCTTTSVFTKTESPSYHTRSIDGRPYTNNGETFFFSLQINRRKL